MKTVVELQKMRDDINAAVNALMKITDEYMCESFLGKIAKAEDINDLYLAMYKYINCDKETTK